MGDVLVGQLIGAIREVWFAAADAPSNNLAAIEIETKNGRYVHLVATTDGASLRLCAGPFAGMVDVDAGAAAARRHWRDLTAHLPAAFDGRPRIVAIRPVDPMDDAGMGPAAREWRITLDSGAVLSARPSARGIGLDSSLG